MKDYLVSVPDSTKVVESTNFIAFDAPAQERKLRRVENELVKRVINNLYGVEAAKINAVNDAHYEAWELLKKIHTMTYVERREAFGYPVDLGDILEYGYNYTAERYAAWEQKKAEEAARKIEVGEIWESNYSKLVVLKVTDDNVCAMGPNGIRYTVSRYTFCDAFTKTGKMIDVNAINFLNSFEEV